LFGAGGSDASLACWGGCSNKRVGRQGGRKEGKETKILFPSYGIFSAV
jgi:hypothetical protein